jgi:hypothetical protein
VQAYYNENTVNLLRHILMGSISLPLEDILVEGERFQQCQSVDMLKRRRRARMAMVSIDEFIPEITSEARVVSFGMLFREAIQRHRTVVLGIYRLLTKLLRHDPTATGRESIDVHRRIVIFYPPHHYQLHPSDMVCTVR